MEHYKPEIIENYATFLVQLHRCPLCQHSMVVEPPTRNSPFPVYYKIDYEAQAAAAGLKIRSKVTSNDEYICIDCANSGRGGFTCYLCKKYKQSDVIEASFGDPPDHLCKDCYATVPAKNWDEVTRELYKEHQFDFC